MELAVYKSCSFAEKREVLGVFWRSIVAPSPKIGEAAVQYGEAAIPFLVVIALEVAVLLVVAIVRSYGTLWIVLAVALEALALSAIWRARQRLAALRSPLPS